MVADLNFQTSHSEMQKEVNIKFEKAENVENRRAWKILNEGFIRRKYSKFEGSYFTQKPWNIGI